MIYKISKISLSVLYGTFKKLSECINCIRMFVRTHTATSSRTFQQRKRNNVQIAFDFRIHRNVYSYKLCTHTSFQNFLFT